MMGGTIRVESPWEDNGVIHHGSTFHVNVVFESAPELPPAAEAVPAPEPAVADNGGRGVCSPRTTTSTASWPAACDGYVSKPFKPADLYRAIEDAVANRCVVKARRYRVKASV
jgi:CheY-like chemotaxis protein